MASVDDDLSVLAKLSLKVAQLEAELEILKCRQGITDLRIDGLVLGTMLTTSVRQEEDASAASAEPSAPPEPEEEVPPQASSPIGVVWPVERHRQQEIDRRRVAFEEARGQREHQAQAQVRAQPQPQPQFASESAVGDRPPTPFPRRYRRQGKLAFFAFIVMTF